MASRKIVGAAAMAGALAVGGVVGVAVGAPGVSNASKGGTATTTTVPGKGPDGRGPGGERGHRFGGGMELEAAAKAIGISVDDLRKELRSGKSIAEVAKAKGVDRQTVVDAMVKAAEARLDEMKEELPDRIGEFVDGKFKAPDGDGPGGRGPGGPGFPGGGPGLPGGPGMKGGQFEAAAKAIGISVEDLHTALHGGKTIAEVATSKNVAEQKVIDAMVKAASDQIDEAVANHGFDKDRAAEIKKDLPARIKTLVEEGFKGRGPGMGGHGHGGPDGFGGPGMPGPDGGPDGGN